MRVLWLEALSRPPLAFNTSRAVVSRGGEPHARVEASSARLRALMRRLPGGQCHMQVDVGLALQAPAPQQRGRPD